MSKPTVKTLAEPVVDRPLPEEFEPKTITRVIRMDDTRASFDVLDYLDAIRMSCDVHVACIGSRVDPSYVLARLIGQIGASCKAVQDIYAERGAECYPAPKEG